NDVRSLDRRCAGAPRRPGLASTPIGLGGAEQPRTSATEKAQHNLPARRGQAGWSESQCQEMPDGSTTNRTHDLPTTAAARRQARTALLWNAGRAGGGVLLAFP